MECLEDHTPLFMDIAKDEKGMEAIEYGYEFQDEYKNHIIRVSFNRSEQHSLERLLLELMKQFDMYIGNDEMTTLINSNVPKAIEIAKTFPSDNTESGVAIKKFINQLEKALEFNSGVFFG